MHTRTRVVTLLFCPVYVPCLFVFHPASPFLTLQAQEPRIAEHQREPHLLVGYFVSSLGRITLSIHPPNLNHTYDIEMWRPKTLLECPEDEPELVFASLPAGPRTRRGVGIRKAGLRNITVTEASFDASASLTPASGVSILSFSSSPTVAYVEHVGFCRSASRI